MSVTREDSVTNRHNPFAQTQTTRDNAPLDEAVFKRMIVVERKRTERSKSPFVLMLLEMQSGDANHRRDSLDRIVAALQVACRDTDLVGWYKDREVVGAMFTGLVMVDRNGILSAILTRVSAALRDELTFEQFSQVSITFHVFPDEWEENSTEAPSNTALYPDLVQRDKNERFKLAVKRFLDVALSTAMLLAISPLFVLIAVLVKVTSKGPVFFRQQRVGQFGKTFTFLKFRSMYVNNDSKVHREYVTKLIAEGGAAQAGGGVFKLTNDKRITRIGGFLRKTSLDELPQFLNVLRGEMSLVGPRPPIPYELAAYQTWHRRRVLEVKPGITGLWQVTGRSRVRFDEMVRLDLRYATTWTPMLDLKILLLTPLAVIRGSGAY